eukprot:TRINITY_DN103339_c0_g1_i1.p1 TRINITY_DN103339_c0_g1~~TRINITY_DN103339_c0_g1_i1.p1  ORF type:complete len:1070 (+),score=160.59 TRINITY_DN103339_c0_g1_i1:48-3257(+)
MSCQENHPEFCGEVTWDLLWWDIFALPAIVQLVLIFFLLPFRRFWAAHQSTRIISLVHDWVGDSNDASRALKHPRFLITCSLLEILCSFWFAFSWAHRTYTRTVGERSSFLDKTLSIVLVMTYVINSAHHHFSWSFALRPAQLINIVTVVPTLARSGGGGTSLWFSFSYLRCVNALQGLEKLDQMGFFRNMHDRDVLYMRSAFSVFAMVTSLVGTVFNLEIIGDPEAIKDEFIQTPMGDLSVMQMTYWIFTTISTVGYGDFSPTTVLSRIFIIFAIVVGVVFFSNLATELSEAAAMENSGKGEYRPSSHGAQHVVLLGGGVRNPSTVTQSFIQALFKHDSEDLPDLVMISGAEMSDVLKSCVQHLPLFARKRCKYFVADPTNPDDMERVRMAQAASVFILPSLLAADTAAEDSGNMLRGLAVRNMYPDLSFLLMLLRSVNKKIAVQQGFLASRTFSVNEQKSGLFALSCLSRGFSTLIALCIIEPDSTVEQRHYADSWREEYEEGRKFKLQALSVGKKYQGMHFREFAKKCSHSGILPLSIQVNGKIKLNPDRQLEHEDLVFALVRSESSALEFQDEVRTGDWRKSFLGKQQTARQSVKQPDISATSNIMDEGTEEHEETNRALPSIADWANEARAIARTGGHHILVLLPGAPWQQVNVFLRTLRADHLPVFIPIVVLFGQPLPATDVLSELFLKYTDTAFISDFSYGAISIDDLVNCGLEKARCVALLPGIDVKGDKRMMDGAGLTLLACIESYCAEKKLPNIPVTLEMHQEESVRYMQKFSPRDKQFELAASVTDPKGSFMSHPRVASGTVFTGSCLGAALARSWSLPGSIELIEALILGSNNQLSYPWQIKVPTAFVDKCYGDFARSFIDDHGALTLGLFRLCFADVAGDGDGTRFVMANPDQSMPIRQDDWVMMLGDAAFGRYCFSAGLLANTDDSSTSKASIDLEAPFKQPEGRISAVNMLRNSSIDLEKPFQEPEGVNSVETKAQKLRSLAAQLTELADALEGNGCEFVSSASCAEASSVNEPILSTFAEELQPTVGTLAEEVRAGQVKGVRLGALQSRVSKV